jgi:transposase-like protein
LGIIPLTNHGWKLHSLTMQFGSADIFQPQFQDADAARDYLEAQRWPDGAVCPHCGIVGKTTKLRPMADAKTHARKGTWKCNECREQFSVTVGTVFEGSHIPLNRWLLAIHLLCASKKGMSAHQMHRMLKISYKSAWFMCHRLRYAMTQEPLFSKLHGTIEVDECYIGGREKGKRGLPGVDSKKIPVVALVERKADNTGEVRAVAFDNQPVTAKQPTDCTSVHRTYGIAKKGGQQRLTWKQLQAQFGGDYSDAKDFKRKAKAASRKVAVVYFGSGR